MTTLVTGGRGFAAFHLAEYLLEQGQDVTLVDRASANTPSALPAPVGARVESADLTDSAAMLSLLRDTRPQRIYHLGALSSPAESLRDATITYEVNFGGTLNLLAAWQQLQFDSRFLFVSSAEVYGSAEGRELPLREDGALQPLTPYAGSKAAAEMLVLQYFQSYGLPIIRVRPFNHTGPRQAPTFVCSSFAQQIAEIDFALRPPVISVGNLKACRDFSDVRDIVRGYYSLLEKGKAGEVYQLSSGSAVSIESILQALIALAAKPVEVRVDPSRVRAREVPVIFGDSSKAREAAGWTPQYDLGTTLRDLKAYWDHAIRAFGCGSSPDPV